MRTYEQLVAEALRIRGEIIKEGREPLADGELKCSQQELLLLKWMPWPWHPSPDLALNETRDRLCGIKCVSDNTGDSAGGSRE